MKPRYGYTDDGTEIIAPSGWAIIPEGGDIPQVHREFLQLSTAADPCGRSQWAGPRRCHSTMTPMCACVWGDARAFAKERDSRVPLTEEGISAMLQEVVQSAWELVNRQGVMLSNAETLRRITESVNRSFQAAVDRGDLPNRKLDFGLKFDPCDPRRLVFVPKNLYTYLRGIGVDVSPEEALEGTTVVEAPTYREERFQTSRGTLALRFNDSGEVQQLIYPLTPVEFITVNFNLKELS